MNDIEEIRGYLDAIGQEQTEAERSWFAPLQEIKSLFTQALDCILSSEEDGGYDIKKFIEQAENSLGSGDPLAPLRKQRKMTAKCEKALQAMPKNASVDFWGTENSGEKLKVLNEIVAEHFIREGRFDIADTFCKESGTVLPEELLENFSTLVSVVQAIDKGDLEPAIKWVEKYSSRIDESKSHLDFCLYRARYIQILTKPIEQEYDWKHNILKAQAFAKSKLSKFSSTHQKNLQELACAMLYAPDIKSSPYPNLSDLSLYSSVRGLFAREFCRMHGYVSESPLHVITCVGSVALPAIAKMSYVLRNKTVCDLSKIKTIPIELPHFPDQRFHSVFSCPVSKEPSSSENPPIMLACGHVICKNCVTCLSKSAVPLKFKCPYCPIESSNREVLRLYI